MPEQDAGAGELDHAEEVLRVVLEARDQSPRVVEPGKEAFDFPPAFEPREYAAVLGVARAVGPIGRDHLDAVAAAQLGVEQVRVVALVADQSRGELAEE